MQIIIRAPRSCAKTSGSSKTAFRRAASSPRARAKRSVPSRIRKSSGPPSPSRMLGDQAPNRRRSASVRSASGSTRMTLVAKVLRSVSSSRRAGRSKATTKVEVSCRSACASMSLSVVLPKPSGARTAVGLPAFILLASFSRSASLRMSSDELCGRDEQCGVTSSMAGSGA